MEGKLCKKKMKLYCLKLQIKSLRGVEFRKWANSVLKNYIVKGYAVNNNRINQLGEVIRIMKRTENSLDSKQIAESKPEEKEMMISVVMNCMR